LSNFVAGTHLAVVMVDNDLRIRRFTPQAEKQLKLIASDVGRPINDIKLPLDLPRLAKEVLEVIHTVAAREFDVKDTQGCRYLLRLQPYLTLAAKVDGALLVLVDIDRQKQAEERLRASEERYRLLIEGAEGVAIMALDDNGCVTGWNAGAERLFGYHDSETLG